MVDWGHLLLPPIASLICLLILVLQSVAISCYWRKYGSTTDTIFVICCVVVCFCTNIFSCVLGILLETAPSCNVCDWAPMLTQLSYCTTKLGTYLFYLQRARLAQSFRPVIPTYCFTKIFPTIFVIVYIAFLFVFALKAPDNSHCEPTDAFPSFITTQWCYVKVASKGHFINSGLFVELSITLFFGWLFVQPLIRLIRTNEDYFRRTYTIDNTPKNLLDSYKTSHKSRYTDRDKISMASAPVTTPSQTQQQLMYQQSDTRYIETQELRTALWYNIILSVLSLSASIGTMVIWPLAPHTLWPIPWIDYTTNSVTTFFMLGRNRKFLARKLCGNKIKKCCAVFCCFCCTCFYWCCTRKQLMQIQHLDSNDRRKNTDDSDSSVLSTTQEYFELHKQLNDPIDNVPNYQAVNDATI